MSKLNLYQNPSVQPSITFLLNFSSKVSKSVLFNRRYKKQTFLVSNSKVTIFTTLQFIPTRMPKTLLFPLMVTCYCIDFILLLTVA